VELGRTQDRVRDGALLDELLALELAAVVAIRDRVDAHDRDVQEMTNAVAGREEIAHLPRIAGTEAASVGRGVQHEVGSRQELVDVRRNAQVDTRAARQHADVVAAFAQHANRIPAQHTRATGDHDHAHAASASPRRSPSAMKRSIS
jgi:hypothetical protein